jgi:phosphoribosylaminoimidazole-succinocarboxamide synthase
MAPSSEPLTELDISQSTGWKKIASGKVREIFEIDQKTLLFVATDRISAYDFKMKNVSLQAIIFDEIGSQKFFSAISYADEGMSSISQAKLGVRNADHIRASHPRAHF